jgi:membrane protease YdiL (CAAX protease family)
VSNGAEQPANQLTVTDVLTVLTGVALFARWLLMTALGRQSLANSKPRRNCLMPLAPLLLFLMWMFGIGLLQEIAARVAGHIERWRALFLSQVVYSVASVGTVALILVLAKLSFARGLKGFGLRPRSAPKDLGLAFVTLLTVWPLILAAMSLTVLVTRALYGPEYRIPQHEALKLITESPSVPLQVILAIVAVLVAPVVEELLFRGLFQTTIRSYIDRPWLAIVLTSIVFASIHPDRSHRPSLFVLALGLGYAYEKSGSLLRPIFMHAMFNGIAIATVLTQGPGWLY